MTVVKTRCQHGFGKADPKLWSWQANVPVKVVGVCKSTMLYDHLQKEGFDGQVELMNCPESRESEEGEKEVFEGLEDVEVG